MSQRNSAAGFNDDVDSIEDLDDCDEEEQAEAVIHTQRGSYVPKSNELLFENDGDLKPAAVDMSQSNSAAGFNDDVDSIEDLDDCDEEEKVEAMIHTVNGSFVSTSSNIEREVEIDIKHSSIATTSETILQGQSPATSKNNDNLEDDEIVPLISTNSFDLQVLSSHNVQISDDSHEANTTGVGLLDNVSKEFDVAQDDSNMIHEETAKDDQENEDDYNCSYDDTEKNPQQAPDDLSLASEEHRDFNKDFSISPSSNNGMRGYTRNLSNDELQPFLDDEKTFSSCSTFQTSNVPELSGSNHFRGNDLELGLIKEGVESGENYDQTTKTSKMTKSVFEKQQRRYK
eukprot:6896397-Ditylum_brightwellii.AAC.1